MPPQQRLRNCAGRVWPKYRYGAWAAVGLKGFGRRQVAFVGPPEAVLFCEASSFLPAFSQSSAPILFGLSLQACQASRRGRGGRSNCLGPCFEARDGKISINLAWDLECAAEDVFAPSDMFES